MKNFKNVIVGLLLTLSFLSYAQVKVIQKDTHEPKGRTIKDTPQFPLKNQALPPWGMKNLINQPNTIGDLQNLMMGGVHGVGNGGDFLRANFIQKGQRIINYLTQTEEGQKFAELFNLDVISFNSILNTKVIVPVLEKPIDNLGTPVDAVFKNQQLQLYVPAWEKFLLGGADVYVMIFHEMLRATSQNDDDYIVSRHLDIFASNISWQLAGPAEGMRLNAFEDEKQICGINIDAVWDGRPVKINNVEHLLGVIKLHTLEGPIIKVCQDGRNFSIITMAENRILFAIDYKF